MDRIGVFFGGKSSEHEVSLMSCEALLNNIDTDRHQVIPIGITKKGKWMLFKGRPEDLPHKGEPEEVLGWERFASPLSIDKAFEMIDFAFPVLHGNVGEDGRLQGLFETMEVPYAGSGVAGSALCMDKILSKKVFVHHNLTTSEYLAVRRVDYLDYKDTILDMCEDRFPYPMFVKPANTGSSVGISKVRSRQQLEEAMDLAGEYDERILVEENIDGREVECAVIGNERPEVTCAGEIIFQRDFYDYEAKYNDDSGTKIIIPAEISDDIQKKIKGLAREAYIASGCSGFARVDFIVEKGTNEVYINEINTLPGMTRYSMFPGLWAQEGLSFTELIERIIDYGYERYNAKNNR